MIDDLIVEPEMSLVFWKSHELEVLQKFGDHEKLIELGSFEADFDPFELACVLVALRLEFFEDCLVAIYIREVCLNGLKLGFNSWEIFLSRPLSRLQQRY